MPNCLKEKNIFSNIPDTLFNLAELYSPQDKIQFEGKIIYFFRKHQ